MKTLLERDDICAIANEVVEMLEPLISDYVEQKETDEILTIDEVTEYFKLKKPQIYYWVSESKYVDNPMPYMKAGKHLRFSKKEFVEWLKNKVHKVDIG